jgi:hypothetical protein
MNAGQPTARRRKSSGIFGFGEFALRRQLFFRGNRFHLQLPKPEHRGARSLSRGYFTRIHRSGTERRQWVAQRPVCSRGFQSAYLANKRRNRNQLLK